MSDRGAAIVGYEVEKLDLGATDWIDVNLLKMKINHNASARW